MKLRGFAAIAAGCCLLATPARAQAPSYLLFESGPVRPLAFSPDKLRLFAVNTPDGHLEIFDVGTGGQLTRAGSVPVGLEPVAVAARTNDEVWVVNHLSDSVSIVSLAGAQPRVVRTLHVGDEPNDIVFAGPGGGRAFISSAHRGQNSPNGGRINRTDPSANDQSQHETPGVGRADVWVFNATDPGSELGGTPLTVITLFGDKPRALAVNGDGSRVYAAVFHSGNQTTVLNEGLVCNTSPSNMSSDTVEPACTLATSEASPGGSPPPHQNHEDVDRPETGLIVKLNRDGGSSGQWQDELDRNWNGLVRLDLPDRDVFEIDANDDPPSPVNAGASDGTLSCLDGTGCWSGVGTVLFDMAVRPNSGGKIYVTNLDSQNHVRFEGPGMHATGKKPVDEPTTVQGNLAHARITVLDGSDVLPRHLNNHLDYSVLPAPTTDRDKSLATPLQMAFSSDGSTLYVAAFGSRKIGIIDTGLLEGDNFTPSAGDHIELSGGGPAGLLLEGGKLYVLTRFDNSLAVIDAASRTQDQKLALFSPEPQSIIDGRPFLYDARLTSSNGEASCSSCHIFGDMDDLGWDLGDPDGDVVPNTNTFNPATGTGPLPAVYHPSKGPMTTQSLRGLANMGPEHWRGDRQGGEAAAFTAFNVAFPGLLGRATQLTTAEMAAFTAFGLQLRYPPNPIRKLDNSLRADEDAGLSLYSGRVTDGAANCNGCHVLDEANGHFGGDGRLTFEGETQHFKVPHLRNAYQKVGMFGIAQFEAEAPSPPAPPGTFVPVAIDGPFQGDPTPFGHKGAQIRGFGYGHDGALDTIFRFTSVPLFDVDEDEQRQLQAAIVSFPSDLAPIVGQQVTLTQANQADATVTGRIDLMELRAGTTFVSKILGGSVTECDVVAHALVGGVQRGALYDPGSDTYEPDDGGVPVSSDALRGLVATNEQEITYTCAPPGSGRRMALDRDEDDLINGVETGTGIFVSASDTGSSPAARDSDGDGFDDGIEVLSLGSDPNDPFDPGVSATVPTLAPSSFTLLVAMLGLAGMLASRRVRPRRA